MHIKDLYRDEPALDPNSRPLDIPVFKPQWHLELTSLLGLAVLINICFSYYQSYPAVCKSVGKHQCITGKQHGSVYCFGPGTLETTDTTTVGSWQLTGITWLRHVAK